jgi:3-dehydroquinate synthase
MIRVNLRKAVSHSYPITIEPGILSRLPQILQQRYPASCYVIICDQITKRFFGKRLQSRLMQQKLKTALLAVPAGERVKSQKYKTFLEESMLKLHCGRDSLILVLGGGVVGDLAGFVAATYMRGISYVQLPTTFLSAVDSSIGGKTGIDTAEGKNLIGAFWQPKAVFVDLNCLQSLPQKQLIAGLVEAVKMFATFDAESFALVEKNLPKILKRDQKLLKRIVQQAAAIKAAVISRDERESGERMVLNFGHTIGHALEKLSGYKLLHGEAVAAGMVTEARIAMHLGILPENRFNRLDAFIGQLVDVQRILRRFSANQIVDALQADKKAKAGQPRFILISKIGKVYVKQHDFAHLVDNRIVRKSLNFKS